MYLGIEIGGTKLQLGVGAGDGSPLVALERFDVDISDGAVGILKQIELASGPLIQRHGVKSIGCGFGGPVDVAQGTVVKSHHVEGWDGFRLAEWFEHKLGRPARIANDADTAALAEAHYGAGRDANPMFYVTVGTGIGGGLIINRRIYHGHGLAAAELGHLRPGLHADRAEENLEALASGWGIAAEAQSQFTGPVSHRLSHWISNRTARQPEAVRQRLLEEEQAAEEHVADLLSRVEGDPDRLTAKIVGQAAGEGNEIALEVLHRATTALGWALAQVITLLSPQRIVIGGGVSLLGESLFFGPIRQATLQYVFPPLIGTCDIVPAELGEEVVVHGALALAAQG